MRNLKVFAGTARLPVDGRIHRIRLVMAATRKRSVEKVATPGIGDWVSEWKKTYIPEEMEAALFALGDLLARYEESNDPFVEFTQLKLKHQ